MIDCDNSESLTDRKTETFHDDDDKAKIKNVRIEC